MEKQTKFILYQVFPRLFGNTNANLIVNGSIEANGSGKFSAFTTKALNKIKELGITHIWYTGIIEHATQTAYTAYGTPRDHTSIVKGKAGSPYAIKDYYDVDPDLADNVEIRMKEFEDLIKRTHKAKMKVIIDFVPNHVSREYHSDTRPPYIEDLGQYDDTTKAFAPDNNFYYIPGQPLAVNFGEKGQEEDFEYSEYPAKATGNDCFSTMPGVSDWYETIKLNYGIDYVNGGTRFFTPIPSTWKKMLEILLFWTKKGVDGFRCDMAEMVPVEFWGWAIPIVKNEADVCFIAEVYNPAEYRNYIWNGQFDYLYDKVGLYDTLRAIVCGQASAKEITKCWQAVEGIRPQMLGFMENHDEQRIASDFFAGNAQAGIPAMIVAATMNVNPVMIYNGQELGERGMDKEGFSGRDGRTTIFDYWSMTTVRNWVNDFRFDEEKLADEQKTLRKLYAKLLNIAKNEAVIARGSFHDLMYANENNPGFNSDYVYTFLRKYKNEALLVAVNFNHSEQTARIIIPPQAFSALKIEDNKAAVLTDLLTGEESISTLTYSCPFQVNLPSYSGVFLKFTYKNKHSI